MTLPIPPSINAASAARRAPLTLLFLVAVFFFAACSAKTPPGFPPALATYTFPDYLQGRAAALYNDGERNWVLHLNEMAVMAMRRNDRETAKVLLDESILWISDVFGDSPAASRARNAFFAEDAKLFKGDPYERSMAFFYRGILHMQDANWSSALSYFRAANFQDQFAEEDQFRSDWTIFDFMIAACEVQLGEGLYARETWRRGAENYRRTMETYSEAGIDNFPFDPDSLRPVGRDDNLLVIVQTGTHPRKVPTGRYGQVLSYRRGPSPRPSASVSIAGAQPRPAVFTDSIFFQATTRGGRYFDHIAGRKVFYKDAAQYASVAAAIAGWGTLLLGANDEAAIIGFALIGTAYLLAIVSELVQPAVDTRTWTGIPDSLGVYTASIQAGDAVPLQVRHAGGRAAEATVPVPPAGQGLSVVLLFPGNESSLLVPERAPRRVVRPF